MHILSKRSLSVLIASSAVIGSLALAGTAFAASSNGLGHGGATMPRPAIVGIVASISGTGNTLTVNSKNWQRSGTTTPTTSTTYTVDATNATVTKAGASSSVSAIAVGDQVMIKGTVTGTNVVAIAINDGKGKVGRPEMSGQKSKTGTTSNMPAITGNGQPVIGGTVMVNSDGTLTVTTKSGVIYAVTVASTATISKMGVTGTATIANVVNGDNVVIQGTVNGTSVTASSVIDQGTTPSKPSISGSPEGTETHGGFFGAVGGFFSHLFGF